MASCQFSDVTCRILDVVFAHQVSCKNKQVYAIIKKLAGFVSTMVNTRENLKESNEFSSIFKYIRVELDQLYCVNCCAIIHCLEKKSLALCARDLIFFTTDLQTVNYDSKLHG